MAADSNCIFCQIVAGKIPATLVHEDDRTVAFMDINPTVHGHVLVVPRAHSTDISDIASEDLAACMETARTVTRQAIDGLGADGANILQNTGRAAGQAVFHFHIHVVPRHSGDGLPHFLNPQPGDPEQIAAAAAEIRGA